MSSISAQPIKSATLRIIARDPIGLPQRWQFTTSST